MQKIVIGKNDEIENRVKNVYNIVIGNNEQLNISNISITAMLDNVLAMVVLKYALENNELDKDKPVEIIYSPVNLIINALFIDNKNKLGEQVYGWSFSYKII